MTNVPKRESFRIRLGDLDDSRFRFGRRAAAWTTYLQIAADVHPPVISSLITDESLEMVARFREERRLSVESQAQAELDQFIAEWCGHWGFIEYFAHDPAQNTVVDAFDARESGKPLPTTFVCDVHGNRHDGTDLKFTRTTVMNPATGEIREEGFGTKLSMHLPDFHWNPTRETLTDALKRITDAIKPIVRAELDMIRDSYLADGYEPVVPKRDKSKDFELVDPEQYRNWGFEWVARQKLRGETPRSIADALSESLTNVPDERTIQRRIREAKKELLLSDDSKPQRR